MIKSISYDQNEILQNILDLNGLKRFDVDLTYGNGSFYKKVPEPEIKIDIDPQKEGVSKRDSINTLLNGEWYRSVVFDPPFLTYIKEAREHNSVMARRFSGYWAYRELEDHYQLTLIESHRILKKKGILVFKCQDIIHNHKMHATHINVINWAKGLFRLKDMFILAAKHRMPMSNKKGEKKRVQKHARVFHSYFLVLERL